MKSAKQAILNTYHVWDSRKIAALLPAKPFVDVTITSPPYWDRRDYGSRNQIGYGQGYENYLTDLEAVFRSIYTMTTEKGSLWVISDTIKQNGELKLLPFELAARLKHSGWILQDIIIWNKDKTLPWSHQGKLRNIFEYIAFYSKGPQFNYFLDRVRDVTDLREWWVRYPERYSPMGKAPTRTWTIPIPRQGSWGNNWVRHFCPLPPELVKRILLLTTSKGDVVLDPFSGSGAVLAQADIMGRKYVGLDLNSKYRMMFESKVLPAIRKLNKVADNNVDETEREKKLFNTSIRALRKTKYAKELIRLYRREHDPLKLDGVLILQGEDTNSIEVIFFFPRKVPARFLARGLALCKKAPLSKYGLSVDLKAESIGVLKKRWLEERGLRSLSRLYLYTGGRTYAWIERLTVRSLLSLNEAGGLGSLVNGYPPLLSNISVKLNPKTGLSVPQEAE